MRLTSGSPDPVSRSGVAFAAGVTVLTHVVMGLGIVYADTSSAVIETPTNTEPKSRRGFGEVAYERRRIEMDCTSIPDCEPEMDPVVVELKVAKLGALEPDSKKLPELQTYEQPELVEEGINLESPVEKVRPLPFKEFKARKERLDRRRRKRKDPFKRLKLFDDDPRKRATKFERITGRLDGNPYGRGVDQDKFDTYFSRMAYALYNRFDVSSSLGKDVIRKQLVRIRITSMSEDGLILSYHVKRRARHKAYTMSAMACIRNFVPAEGGRFKLPKPDTDILEYINKKGIVVDLDGRLLQK